MNFDWLWQGFTFQILWELALVVGIGVALERLKAKWPLVAARVLYALGGATCIAILLFTFTGHGLLLKKPPEPVNEENIETNMKIWADNVTMSLTRNQEAEPSFFSYLARVNGAGDPVEVFRAKVKPGYLQFKATISLPPDLQKQLAKFSAPEVKEFIDRLTLEMTRLKMTTGATVTEDDKGRPLQLSATLQRAVPVSDLNEGVFMERFDEVAVGVAQVKAAIQVSLDAKAALTRRPVSQ